MTTLKTLIDLCRKRIATRPGPGESEGWGGIEFARELLTAIGEPHGDEAERTAEEERWRIVEAHANEARRAVELAQKKARDVLETKRREVGDFAIQRVWSEFQNCRGDRITVLALEHALNEKTKNSRAIHKLGRMKASIDSFGNVGVEWENE